MQSMNLMRMRMRTKCAIIPRALLSTTTATSPSSSSFPRFVIPTTADTTSTAGTAPPCAHLATSSATRYAGRHVVTLIPGDGVGREIASSVRAIFDAAGVPVEWDTYEVSGASRDPGLLRAAVASVKRNKVGLKGILETVPPLPSINVAMRKELDLFASIAHIKSILPPTTSSSSSKSSSSINNNNNDNDNNDNVYARFAGVDIVLVRENMEGEYSGIEHEPAPGVMEMFKVVTRANSERIAKFAFDYAVLNGRKKVTAVHKANIMKLTDGLFLNSCKDVAQLYEGNKIAFDSMIVDNASMQLVSKPSQFDVVVLGNLYGSILSNVGAGLVGGAGMVPGANIGRDYAVFEAGCRHVGKQISGRNVANPSAHILSATYMLEHLRLSDHASRISDALVKTIVDDGVRTADMGGNASTTEFTVGENKYHHVRRRRYHTMRHQRQFEQIMNGTATIFDSDANASARSTSSSLNPSTRRQRRKKSRRMACTLVKICMLVVLVATLCATSFLAGYWRAAVYPALSCYSKLKLNFAPGANAPAASVKKMLEDTASILHRRCVGAPSSSCDRETLECIYAIYTLHVSNEGLTSFIP